MNTAIDSARQARTGGGTLSPSALYAQAKEDALALLTGLGEVVAEAPEGHLRLLYGHLTVDELAASIYRHAMYEAGAIVDARTRKPYDTCPYCAYQVPA